MRFNPPPNWPPPPPGWVPDANWTPDPSWPPPPPGWPFWVEDSKARKPTLLWIALVIIAVIILVAGSVFAVAANRKSHGVEGSHSTKPDISRLSRDLLVGKSAFPDFDGGKRRSGLGRSDPKASGMPGLSVNPEECADFLGSSNTATQTAYATVSKADHSGLRSMEVHLAITPERRDLRSHLKDCQSFTVSLELGARALTFDAQLDPLDAQGAPPWSVGTVMKRSGSPIPGLPISMSMTTSTISGYYRGVLVAANSSRVNPRSKDGKDSGPVDADTDELVTLFNAQVQTLEAAP